MSDTAVLPPSPVHVDTKDPPLSQPSTDETASNSDQSLGPFPSPSPALQRLFDIINAADDPSAVEQALLIGSDDEAAAAADAGSDGGVSLLHAHDEHGLTPLHQAAYRGRARVCGALLDRGANVNSQQHEHKYTPLHFAALSGSAETVRRLLAAGADPTLINSVSRTASQMAGFVGNHKLVTVIASYVPRSVVDRYTVVRKQEKHALLPPHLAPSTHQLLLDTNIHPVHVLIWVCGGVGETSNDAESSPDVFSSRLTHAGDIAATLKQISEKYVRKQLESESGELVAIKAHYISQLLLNIDAQWKQVQQQNQSQSSLEQQQQNMCQQLARKWLRSPKASNSSSGVQPPFFDALVRQCIKSFEHRELPAFRTLVTAVVHGSSSASASNGSDSGTANRSAIEGHSEALQVLSATVNCQSGFGVGAGDEAMCETCWELGASKLCSVCRAVSYCDRRCQKIHWPLHRDQCSKAVNENVTARGRDDESSNSSVVASQTDVKTANLEEKFSKVCVDSSSIAVDK